MASMRSLLFYLCFALAAAQLATNNRQRELGIQDLPVCGLTCLAVSLPGHCEADDTPCICESHALAVKMSECMQANCTVADGLMVAKVQASLCRYPHPNKTVEGTAALSTLFAVAVIAVVLRLVARAVAREIFIEDYMIAVAILLTISMLVPLLMSFKDGLGTHLYDLVNANSLKRVLLSLYISENTYIISLTLIKTSILAFYLRLFKLYRGFRIAVIISIVVTTLSSIIILVLTILSCRPVERFWDRDIKRGSCLSIPKLAYANSGLAIIQDVVIITLPVLLVAGLEAMTRRKKMYVAGMFGVGGLGCIATIVRLSTLEGFGDSIDPTWDYVPVTYWTSIELAAGFVVSSMPAIRTLCQTLARKYGIGWSPLRKEQDGGVGAPPAGNPPRGDGGGRLGAVMAQVSRPGNAILSRGSRAARAVGGSLGSVVDRVRPARAGQGYRQIQWDSWSGSGVTYPADAYCHPAFEDAGEASDAAGPPSRPGSSSGNRLSSFEVRTQPRSHVNYHLPRRHVRKEPGGAATEIGLPSPRRKSFRPPAARRELVTI
ncbi:hypothetical protein RB595_005969 [Gaeumannomyces hyphopodioides]